MLLKPIPARPDLADVDLFTLTDEHGFATSPADMRYPNAGVTIVLFRQDMADDTYWTIPLYHN